MRVHHGSTIVLAMLCCLSVLSARQQPAANGPGTTGFRGDFLKQVAEVEKKVEDLARAVPEEKYLWRPMDGVRSVSEVYMHIAGTNYLMASMIGIKSPEGLERDMEKNITVKSHVLEMLRSSFQHIRNAIISTPDSNLEKPAKFFGEETTVRDVMFRAALHMHEHLGQSIAYARMNRIVPPWTAAEQAREKAKAKQ